MYYITAVKPCENCENLTEYPEDREWLLGTDRIAFVETLDEAMKFVSGEGHKSYAHPDYEYTAIEEIEPGLMPRRKLIGLWGTIYDEDDYPIGHKEVEIKFIDKVAREYALLST